MGRKAPAASAKPLKTTWKRDFKLNWVVYACFLPAFVFLFIFNYLPMAGIAIAFQNFKMGAGIFGSPWVGFQNFIDLFTGETFGLVMRNTIAMALLNLTVGFIAPLILALLISEVKVTPFKRTAQTVSYMPYFVAAVVVAQLVTEFVGRNGAITSLLTALGFEHQNWLANNNIPAFWLINTFTEIWQGAGFGAIIYVAAISNVSGELHEAAAIDGAGRWKRVTKITLPSIFPLIIIMLTLKVGLIFTQGFDKILLLYMPATYDVSDVISTYTYRMAFGAQNSYGLSAASGLFQSVVATTLLLTSNYLNKKATKYSLF